MFITIVITYHRERYSISLAISNDWFVSSRDRGVWKKKSYKKQNRKQNHVIFNSKIFLKIFCSHQTHTDTKNFKKNVITLAVTFFSFFLFFLFFFLDNPPRS